MTHHDNTYALKTFTYLHSLTPDKIKLHNKLKPAKYWLAVIYKSNIGRNKRFKSPVSFTLRICQLFYQLTAGHCITYANASKTECLQRATIRYRIL